ncbi:MFS transporter [Rhodopila sp.]|uniref:MFS transporter n=1 Tax=Rhodopila sp. TaxID=2480087 RepID=UPI003D09A89B
MSDVAARLERLPFCNVHRRLLFMGGLGYTFDAMDGAIMAFVLPVVSVLWSLSSVQTGVLGSATYIGFFFGAICSGTLGDLLGRRFVMMGALGIYSAATALSALAITWPQFFVLRIVAGFGSGAESVIIAPFLTEFVASRYRGRFTGALAGFFSFGFVGAALLGNFIIPLAPAAWRFAVFATAVPVVMLLWWRRSLPESPRWLETRGRSQEAEAAVSMIEAGVVAELGDILAPPAAPIDASSRVTTGTLGAALRGNLAALWSRPLRRVTAMSWLMWLSLTASYYAFFTWIPSLLVKSGMTVTRSFGFSLLIYVAQIPGYYSAAWLIDRIGRKALIVSYMLLGGVSALGLANAHDNLQVTVAGALLSFFMNGSYAGLYVYTPELFPTEVRATGCGIASAIGRLGAIASPIVVGYIYPIWGFAGVFGITTAVLLGGALSVLILGIATSGRSLEAITAAELQAAGGRPAANR